MPVERAPVEIWAPGFAAEPLAAALRAARLSVHHSTTLEAAGAEAPLLLAYGDPLALLQADPGAAPEPAGTALAYQPLLGAIPGLERVVRPWRLVNLACFCPPALVAWCVQPEVLPPRPELTVGFAQPEALDALVALQALEAQPRLLEAYLRLERHPRGAALDHRPADDGCLARLQAACTPPALAAAWLRRCELLEDLERADQQRQALHHSQRDNQALRERLMNLELKLARRADLELSLQLSQEELGQLGRRIALLEQMVSDGAEASRCVQEALARVLGG